MDIEMPSEDTFDKCSQSSAGASNASCSTARSSPNFRRHIALGVDHLKRTNCNAFIDTDCSNSYTANCIANTPTTQTSATAHASTLASNNRRQPTYRGIVDDVDATINALLAAINNPHDAKHQAGREPLTDSNWIYGDTAANTSWDTEVDGLAVGGQESQMQLVDTRPVQRTASCRVHLTTTDLSTRVETEGQAMEHHVPSNCSGIDEHSANERLATGCPSSRQEMPDGQSGHPYRDSQEQRQWQPHPDHGDNHHDAQTSAHPQASMTMNMHDLQSAVRHDNERDQMPAQLDNIRHTSLTDCNNNRHTDIIAYRNAVMSRPSTTEYYYIDDRLPTVDEDAEDDDGDDNQDDCNDTDADALTDGDEDISAIGNEEHVHNDSCDHQHNHNTCTAIAITNNADDDNHNDIDVDISKADDSNSSSSSDDRHDNTNHDYTT